MPRRTIIREYPEVVRGERGLTLRVLGQTFEPRPGTVSARALEDAALDEQLRSVSGGEAVRIDGRIVGFTARRELDTSLVRVSTYETLDVLGRSTDLEFTLALRDPVLLVVGVTLTRRGDREAEWVGRPEIEEGLVERVRAVVESVTRSVSRVVPELRVRCPEVEVPAFAVAHGGLVAVRTMDREARDVLVSDVVSHEDYDGELEVISVETSSGGRRVALGVRGPTGAERTIRLGALDPLTVHLRG